MIQLFDCKMLLAIRMFVYDRPTTPIFWIYTFWGVDFCRDSLNSCNNAIAH